MSNIIVAFPGREEAQRMRALLTRNGFRVSALCVSSAAVLQASDLLREGIVICPARLKDTTSLSLREMLPESVDMLLLASSEIPPDEEKHLYVLPPPVSVHDVTQALAGIEKRQEDCRKALGGRPRARSVRQRELIEKAKQLLMERNGMTEEAAHRYLQKTSMDNGTGLCETAGMILSLMQDE